jgi:peptidoglycan hydrolase CwlO-like protein
MKRQLTLLPLLPILLGAAVVFSGAIVARADESNSPETRLREALRNTLLQLRTVNADRDNLQGQVTDLQSQKDDLTKQVADLTKKAAATQEADTKAIAVLKGQVSDQETSIASLQQSLDQWKAAERKAEGIAGQTESKRAKLADLSMKLQRVVDDQKRKNQEMFKTGMEILDRYEKFGLGEALTAKEPFIGITRTKFETLVQDYEDKLTDQSITSSQPTPARQSPRYTSAPYAADSQPTVSQKPKK